MKISHIDIRTVMGARAVDIQLDTPIHMLAGGNGSGKSSTLESVRMALGENPLRLPTPLQPKEPPCSSSTARPASSIT